jgi:hypothetical protein
MTLSEPAVTGLDESFGHQLVASRSQTEHLTPRWAERTYYLLHVDDELTINAGRQLYMHDGHWWAFTAAATPEQQDSFRLKAPYAAGDDPDGAEVGPLRLDVAQPLEEIRLAFESPEFPLAYDLTFTGRFPPVAHKPTLIEKDGQVVTHTVSFFQSGWFSGVVTYDGVEHEVDRRAGFRDRSWGFRKHDGSPQRGLVVFVGCETETEALYLLLLETASGRRAYTGGWISKSGAPVDTLVSAEHDLLFEGNLLVRGRFDLQFAASGGRTLEFEVENRLYLSAVGYSPDPARRQTGHERLDLRDPATVRSFDGQNDQGCGFSLDGVPGHGYVETGLGVHAGYRPGDSPTPVAA